MTSSWWTSLWGGNGSGPLGPHRLSLSDSSDADVLCSLTDASVPLFFSLFFHSFFPPIVVLWHSAVWFVRGEGSVEDLQGLGGAVLEARPKHMALSEAGIYGWIRGKMWESRLRFICQPGLLWRLDTLNDLGGQFSRFIASVISKELQCFIMLNIASQAVSSGGTHIDANTQTCMASHPCTDTLSICVLAEELQHAQRDCWAWDKVKYSLIKGEKCSPFRWLFTLCTGRSAQTSIRFLTIRVWAEVDQPSFI